MQPVLGHRADMGRVVAAVQNTGVDSGVQGLHAAVQHFGKACEFFDRGHGHGRTAQRRGRAAGGQDFDPEARQPARQIDNAPFVAHADERAGHGGHAGFLAENESERRMRGMTEAGSTYQTPPGL